MKKIFALALAAVMTAGMTTVAFAYNVPSFASNAGNAQFWAIDENDNGVFELKSGADTELGLTDSEGGKKVALFLYVNATTTPITDSDDVDRYKVTADWEVGDIDEKPIIERVKVEYDDDSTDYVYAVTFVLPEAPEKKTADLIGDVTIYKTTSDKKVANNIANVGITYGYAPAWSLVTNGEDFDNTTAIVDFKGYDDIAYMTFGDDFEFEVDVTGQGKLNLKWNTDFNKEFAAMYDYANIDFLTFEYEPSFNKIGTAYIYADENAFVYEVTENGAKEIAGLTWDEDYEAWTFKTRTLGAYAISDVELDEKTVTEDKDDSTTDGGKENPDTGR